MAAELDRLLDAQAASKTGAATSRPPSRSRQRHRSKRRRRSQRPHRTRPPRRSRRLHQWRQPRQCEAAAPVEAASSETTEVEPAPVKPQASTIPAAPPPRRVAAIAKDLFADVMALSEEERIALFT